MPPSFTDEDSNTASDTDTAVVIEGRDVKAIFDREVIPLRPCDMWELRSPGLKVKTKSAEGNPTASPSGCDRQDRVR